MHRKLPIIAVSFLDLSSSGSAPKVYARVVNTMPPNDKSTMDALIALNLAFRSMHRPNKYTKMLELLLSTEDADTVVYARPAL